MNLSDKYVIEMSDKNITNYETRANLIYNGDTMNNIGSIYINKFKIVKKIPVFIPIIVQSPSIYSTNLTYISPVNYYPVKKYMTSLVIVVTDSTLRTSYTNIYWENSRGVDPYLTPDRNTCILNEYFHCYTSIRLLKMIQDAINGCISALEGTLITDAVYFVKNGSSYQIQNRLTQYQILFNNDLQILFPFDFISTADNNFKLINIEKYNVTELNNNEYVVSQTISPSCRMFPFTSLNITATNIPLRTLIIMNEDKNNFNNKITKILTYDLVINDVDSIGDCINYNLESLNKTVKVIGSFGSYFEIIITFSTFDGYNLPLKLNYNEFVTLELILCEQE